MNRERHLVALIQLIALAVFLTVLALTLISLLAPIHHLFRR